MLDVRKLRVLREVAERGSIAAAARTLSFTPSAVSQQLANFERELGTKLLERNGRGVRLTHAATVLVAHSEAVLAGLEEAEAALAATRAVVAGRLVVGAFPTFAAAVLPEAARSLRDRHPEIELSIEEREPETSLPALKAGLLDLAVVYRYEFVPTRPPAAVELETLFTDELYLALPPGHRLAARRHVPLSELGEETWATGYCESACARAGLHACHAAGFDPQVSFRGNDFRVVLGLVAAGLAVALVPGLAARDDRVAFRRLAEPLAREVLVASRLGGGGHPARAAMVETLRAVAVAQVGCP